MDLMPPEHPQRRLLAAEVHARPPEALETPARITYLAVLVTPEERGLEQAHVARLCEHFGVEPPPADVNHWSVTLGELRFKWERHGEFSGYKVIAAGVDGEPFGAPPAAALPAGWLTSLPGQSLVAVHAELIGEEQARSGSGLLARCFGANIVVGSEVGDGAGTAYTDFQTHDDGFSRMLLIDRSMTPRQAGRMMQRMLEIEAYRMLSMLALPLARQQHRLLGGTEAALSRLAADIAAGTGDDEALLHELTRLAAQIESQLAAGQFRYGACRAYYQLVVTRIGELRERRLTGLQTFDEFMARRLSPAVATCAAVSQRLHDLSERVARASGLLSTRVAIARERQNQALLASMDQRAKAQLRLQETVEGLSVAAIVYYAAGLVAYAAKAFKAGGLHLEPDLIVGIAIPLLAGLVLVKLRGARKRAGDA